MITIDGSQGEGGGQVLRSCLSLSLLTGQPFSIQNIRQNRERPGLRPQHLCAVELAAEIGQADVKGAELNSTSLTFSPTIVKSGVFKSSVGTAGSTSLVLQTVLLPLSLTGESSSITISGGTHVPWSPTFDYLDKNFLPFLRQIGFQSTIDLVSAGYYPQGGGRIQAKIHPVPEINGIELTDRGRLIQVRGVSAASNLDRRIAERQRDQVLRRIGRSYPLNDIRVKSLVSKFKGTTICLICDFENSQCCYTALGKLGKPAEKVADEVIDKILSFMNTDGVLDEYLADQILLHLSTAKSSSFFITPKITRHLITNAEVISIFLPAQISIDGQLGEQGHVTIIPG